MGRPSIFSEELADRICDRLIDGESLRAICGDDDMPGKSTVLRWTLENAAFRDQYARARELQGETDADDVGHVAREIMEGRLDAAAGNAAINGLKWSAGKRNAKKYGEALQMKHSGAVGVFDPAKHSTEELNALLAILEPAAVAAADGGGDPSGNPEAAG